MNLPGVAGIVSRSVRLAAMGDVEQGLEVLDGCTNGSALQAVLDGAEGVVVNDGASLEVSGRGRCADTGCHCESGNDRGETHIGAKKVDKKSQLTKQV